MAVPRRKVPFAFSNPRSSTPARRSLARHAGQPTPRPDDPSANNHGNRANQPRAADAQPRPPIRADGERDDHPAYDEPNHGSPALMDAPELHLRRLVPHPDTHMIAVDGHPGGGVVASHRK